jgi:hypothetical protein
MLRFADACRAKASRTALTRHRRFVQRYNRLIDIRQLATTQTKRTSDALALLPKTTVFIFSLQLKLTLDSAMEIFPNFATQFIDLLNRFQTWHEACTVSLRCLSRVTDHILLLVKASDILGKLSDIDFESFQSQTGVQMNFCDNRQRAK